MGRIEEIFVPATVTTVEGLIEFLAQEVIRRGGDPLTVKVIDTETAIPNVRHSDYWPCITFQFERYDDGQHASRNGTD